MQIFCRENGIPVSGSKVELAGRIEVFLTTGEIVKPVKKPKTHRKSISNEPISLDTVITENHRCSQDVRAFFKSVIPNFHFSTYIQNYFKENIGKTYNDVVTAWKEEEERKKDPSYKTEIGSQFEYNQFFRDFFADPANKGKSREEAIRMWKVIKSQPGDHAYKRKK